MYLFVFNTKKVVYNYYFKEITSLVAVILSQLKKTQSFGEVEFPDSIYVVKVHYLIN